MADEASTREHLRLLSIFHYVLAAVTALAALFPVIHLALGLALITDSRASSNPPDAFVGWFFVVFSCLWILFGLLLGACMFFAGRFLRARRNHRFCVIVGGVSCLFAPLGTILGVFTLIVLLSEPARSMFDGAAAGTAE